MPLFGAHNRSASSTTAAAQHNNAQGTASGLLQAAQALGSIGSPAGNLRTAATGTTLAGTDSLYPSNTGTLNFNAGAQPAQAPNNSAAQPNPPSHAIISSPATNNTQQFETPRRQQAYSRHPDELHLGDVDSVAAPKGSIQPRDHAAGAPRINLEQPAPETSQYQNAGHLPGPLQSGGSNRPPTLSSNTTPSVPTLQTPMSQDPFVTPMRSAAQNLSHNYSRSSPSAGYDGQAYQPYTTTSGGSELGQFPTPSSLKYAPGQQRNVSNTPLGLADIRPRADSNLSDAVPGANPYSYDGANAVPTNSNYLAPWAIYAFDWCKWPAHNNDAGKVAVGSYLEDGHNFVSSIWLRPLLC